MTEATGLDEGVRDAVRDLVLVLADSKRLLGYRYAEWMLGAPELEAGIACSSMAQDEWGHARLLYALLKDFDDDVEALEHGREPSEYRNMSVLDRPSPTWPTTISLMVVADGALSVQIEAMRGSRYEPLRQRVAKMLEEERFHSAHGAAWLRRLAEGTDRSRDAMREAFESALEPVLDWFGPDSERARGLESSGVVAATGPSLQDRLLDRLDPHLERLGIDRPTVEAPDEFDEVRRRTGTGAPDEETIRKVRGDRNRVFLLD